MARVLQIYATAQLWRAQVVAALGTASLATDAVDGFFRVPSCAGPPTGTPVAQTGLVPIVVDETNDTLYFYTNGAWRAA